MSRTGDLLDLVLCHRLSRIECISIAWRHHTSTGRITKNLRRHFSIILLFYVTDSFMIHPTAEGRWQTNYPGKTERLTAFLDGTTACVQRARIAPYIFWSSTFCSHVIERVRYDLVGLAEYRSRSLFQCPIQKESYGEHGSPP